VQGLQVAGAARCGRSFLTARRGCPLPTACRARSPKLPAAAACRFAEAAALRGHPLHTTCPRRYLPMRSARAAARRPERSRVTALLRLYNGLAWRRPRPRSCILLGARRRNDVPRDDPVALSATSALRRRRSDQKLESEPT
jgi:hypothetical protein